MRKLLLVLPFIFATAACDKINKSLDNTSEMGAKLDSMVGRMDKLEGQIETTNGKASKLEKFLPYVEMLKDENRKYLSPVPTRIIPLARELAASIPTHELIELTNILLNEINEVDAIGMNDEQKLIDRSATLLTLQCLAGLAPEAKVDEIIATEVYKRGRYEQTVYPFLMMRVQFLRDVYLKESLLATKLTNVGMVEEAIGYAKQMDKIARLKFADRIGIKVKGIKDESGKALEEHLTSATVLDYWTKIKISAENDVDLGQQDSKPRGDTGDTKLDQQNFEEAKSRYASALTTIDGYIQSWNSTKP